MVDDFRGFFLFIGVIILILGIMYNSLPLIIPGSLITLGLGIWLGIDFYKAFKERR